MPIRSILTAFLLTPFALFVGCDGAGSGGDVVARAGEHTLTADRATSLLANRGPFPDNETVIRALAEVWVDYTLLAEAVQRDSTLESVDVDPILELQLEQELVNEFRDSVLQPDTSFTEAELRSAFESEGASARVQARHILLSFPDGATPAQRDSVEALASELKRRALEGENFGDLAREYSDDTGSAQRGGDLGMFGRGDMVPSFEEAAFSLEPGEISEPVETPYGLHVIRVEGRETASFEENQDQFAQQLRRRRLFLAESTYVNQLEGPADVQVSEDAYGVMRALAARPGALPESGSREDALVRYEGGSLTTGDLQTFLQARSPRDRARVEGAQDEQLDGILRSLTRRELMLTAARGSGMSISESRRDSLRSVVVTQLRRAATELGLAEITPEDGESETEAVDRVVQEILERTISGEQRVIPLGSLAFTLRREFGAEVFDDGVAAVTGRLDDAGSESSPGGAVGPADGAAPTSEPPSGP